MGITIPAKDLGLRNKLINPDFEIWQRDTDVGSITTSQYSTADRWRRVFTYPPAGPFSSNQ